MPGSCPRCGKPLLPGDAVDRQDGPHVYCPVPAIAVLPEEACERQGRTMLANLKRGDFIRVECEGDRHRAMVVLASQNGDSLMVMFDGFCGGFVGMMPLLRDAAGRFHELVADRIVEVSREE
jgi:hypothetical protein